MSGLLLSVEIDAAVLRRPSSPAGDFASLGDDVDLDSHEKGLVNLRPGAEGAGCIEEVVGEAAALLLVADVDHGMEGKLAEKP